MTATQVAQGDDDGGGRHSAAATLPPRRTRADTVRLVARGIGQTLITGGLIILLFVVYEVWVTNLFAAAQQTKVQQAFQHVLDQPTVGSSALALPGAGEQQTIPAGSGIANLYIPRLGQDFKFTVVEGVDDADLEKGPGHYSGTALPGQAGNFAVAGHRVGKGEPFLNLDQLQPGDAVVVQVQGFWYVYHVLGQGTDLGAADANGVVGREIVQPTDIGVIAPTPDKADSPASGKYMTMTTCHPKYSASQRMIVHAVLAETKPASGKAIPTELGGTL